MTAGIPPREAERFWSRVDRTGVCWIYLGGKDRDGYGQFGYNRQNYRAHRFALMIAGRAIPNGMVTRHTCDTRACVNPDHLLAGTQRENVADAMARAEHFGSPRALTPDQATAVAERYASGGVTLNDLAEVFGVSRSVIHRATQRAAA